MNRGTNRSRDTEAVCGHPGQWDCARTRNTTEKEGFLSTPFCSVGRPPRKTADKNTGFTLLEILLALSILAVVTAVTYLTFSTVAIGWKKGMKLSDEIQHGDFVMDQLEAGLRSAYYPAGGNGRDYGFRLDNDGDGESARDTISWVKIGPALVGQHCKFAGTPHRVEFTIDDGDDGDPAVSIRAWRILGQVEGFDPEIDVEPIFISKGIKGFNCDPIDPLSDPEDPEWMDEWEDTNKVPTSIQITLYMEPLEEDEDPVKIQRLVTIPVAPLSWGGRGPGKSSSGKDKKKGNNSRKKNNNINDNTRKNRLDRRGKINNVK